MSLLSKPNSDKNKWLISNPIINEDKITYINKRMYIRKRCAKIIIQPR